MKIIFAGTPEFALRPLEKIHGAFGVSAVLTQPDRPQGRKGILTPPPVKTLAESLGIPVLQPEKLRLELSSLKEIDADLMVTCAYGQILTREILDMFPLGVWNIHASLLPAYRGAAPIARVIMDGQKETGITIMRTDEGIDTGDIFLSRSLPISERDTAGTLTEKLSVLGAELIVEALQAIEKNQVTLQKQGEGFVCKKVSRTEVDFSRTAEEVSGLIRGLSPAPLAFGTAGGVTLNFFSAQAIPYTGEEPFGTVLSDSPKQGLIVRCGEGAVRIDEVQPAGGKRMKASDFLNGRKIGKGSRFENKSVL